MDRDGVEPPESEDSRFTVCPATTYGITVHIICKTGKSWNRTKSFGFSVRCADTNHTHFPNRTHQKIHNLARIFYHFFAVSVPYIFIQFPNS